MDFYIKELCEMYNVNTTTVYERIKRKGVTIHKQKRGSRIHSMISELDIDKIITEREMTGVIERIETTYYIYESKLNYMEV